MIQKILGNVTQSLLLHLIIGKSLVIIRDGARKIAALQNGQRLPFFTWSQGRTFISTIRPPTGAKTCTTSVGSASICAGRSRYSGMVLARTVCVWIPLESGATYSVFGEAGILA